MGHVVKLDRVNANLVQLYALFFFLLSGLGLNSSEEYLGLIRAQRDLRYVYKEWIGLGYD